MYRNMNCFTYTIIWHTFSYIIILLLSPTQAQILFPDEVSTSNLNSPSTGDTGHQDVASTGDQRARTFKHLSNVSPGSSSSSSSSKVLFPDEVASNNNLHKSPKSPKSSKVLFPDELTGQKARNSITESSKSSTCFTPAGERGTCVAVIECSNYLPLISQMRNPIVTKFLRERICRVLPRSIKICCPSGKPILPVTPTSQPLPGSSLTTSQPWIGSSLTTSQPLKGSSMIPTERECGISVASRIVGGNEVKPGAWPWLAVLSISTKQFSPICGGSLITKRHVITAAHCFGSRKGPDPDQVRLGEHHLHNNDDNGETFHIVQYRLNSFNSRTMENDIAIVVIDREVKFNDYVRPVCLPFHYRHNEFTGESLTVAGWGKTSVGSRAKSKVPMEADVPVVSLTACSSAYQSVRDKPVIDHRQICAGDGGEDACNGDSGGPLNYYDSKTGRYYLAGIVSFGVGCGRKDFPGVYTRVTTFLDWIEDNAQ